MGKTQSTPSPLLSEPWRALPENNQDHLKFVKSYQPRSKKLKHLRILLHGPVGAGKSSFINSVDSVLQGRVTTPALTDAISGTSFTRKYTTYKIHKDPEGFYSFVFNDIMGLEQSTNSGIHVEDIKLAMMGHVTDGYKFIPGQQMTESDQGFKKSPTQDDKVHVLVCVFPVGSVSLVNNDVVKNLKDIRRAATELGIPQLAVLTKVDEACPEVQRDIKNVHESRYLKEQVEQFSMLLGIPPNSIFLVKNYNSEINTNDDMDALDSDCAETDHSLWRRLPQPATSHPQLFWIPKVVIGETKLKSVKTVPQSISL